MAVSPAVARAPRPITDLVLDLGIEDADWIPYTRHAGKLSLGLVDRLGPRRGRLIAVTGMTPTPYGEGKTTTAIGLAMGLARLGARALVTLRQGSLGPTFGVKGAALGGGAARVVPEDLLALHFTGDFHAVAAAHNLLAAFIDAHLIHGNAIGIDPLAIAWPRVLDQNDAALRQIVTGLGGRRHGVPRQTRFDITAASEVMAIVAQSRDLPDLRARLGRIVVGTARDGAAVTAERLGAAGAMTALLRDALLPNLVQTAEGTPALVHTGPFANIAPGNSSIVADEIALRLGDVAITEAGFGADCGFEKLMHLKARTSGAAPSAAVIVATVRALKHHGRWSGSGEDVAAVRRGLANLARHVEIVRAFGIPAVVALNRFADDTPAEVAAALVGAEALGVPAVASDAFAAGGEGGLALAEAVLETGAPRPRVLYPDDAPAEAKIEAVATRVYGASGVSYDPAAKRALEAYRDLGYGALPVCVAKTPLSLSHDPALLGSPEGFVLPVREVRLQAGAGYLVPIVGEISTMPGLPSRPLALGVDVGRSGAITGLA